MVLTGSGFRVRERDNFEPVNGYIGYWFTKNFQYIYG